MFGNIRGEEEVRRTYRKSTRFLNLQPSDLNASSRDRDLVESASFHTPRGRAAEELEAPLEDADLFGVGNFELNRKRLVNMILTELGHTPADDDLEFVFSIRTYDCCTSFGMCICMSSEMNEWWQILSKTTPRPDDGRGCICRVLL